MAQLLSWLVDLMPKRNVTNDAPVIAAMKTLAKSLMQVEVRR